MRSFWLILPLALLCTPHLRADSVTLVTGEKISGTIKSDTNGEIIIDVPVSDTITDERVLRKEDVAKVDKEQPDELAYKQLIQVQPNSQISYSSATYTQILAALDSFAATYPQSSYLPDIKNLRDQFQDEKQRVDAGQLKYLGQWLSKDEAARRRIQIVAIQIFGTMQQQAAAGDYVGAMQTFATIDQNYNTTRVYPTAVSLAEQVLLNFQQDLARRMEAVKADQDQLQKTIAFTSEPEKSVIIAQAKALDDRANAVIAAAVQSGAKWVPLIPRSMVSIDTLQKTAASESQRLQGIPVATMNASIAKVDAAKKAIEEGNYRDADSLLKDALSLWGENEAAHYWSDRLAEKMATPTPTPVPKVLATPKPTPRPRPSPQMVNIITPVPAPPPEGDKPFYMTFSGATPILAGLLIVVGLGANYIQKKAKKQQTAE
jgi:hypothetical protein